MLHVVSAGEITTLNEKKLVGRNAGKLNGITRKFDASSSDETGGEDSVATNGELLFLPRTNNKG